MAICLIAPEAKEGNIDHVGGWICFFLKYFFFFGGCALEFCTDEKKFRVELDQRGQEEDEEQKKKKKRSKVVIRKQGRKERMDDDDDDEKLIRISSWKERLLRDK